TKLETIFTKLETIFTKLETNFKKLETIITKLEKIITKLSFYSSKIILFIKIDITSLLMCAKSSIVVCDSGGNAGGLRFNPYR
ncbi:MAG: hypothetical protein ACK559_03680, partial [bacterium]